MPDQTFASRIATLADEMAQHDTSRNAPARAVMAMLGDRWTTLILFVLAAGEVRHADLRRVLTQLALGQDISQRVLTLKLRGLERNGFVIRTVTEHVPPNVSYKLSSLGDALFGRVRSLVDWINLHEETIIQARATYDETQD